jgi:hypothetical protein
LKQSGFWQLDGSSPLKARKKASKKEVGESSSLVYCIVNVLGLACSSWRLHTDFFFWFLE